MKTTVEDIKKARRSYLARKVIRKGLESKLTSAESSLKYLESKLPINTQQMFHWESEKNRINRLIDSIKREMSRQGEV